MKEKQGSRWSASSVPFIAVEIGDVLAHQYQYPLISLIFLSCKNPLNVAFHVCARAGDQSALPAVGHSLLSHSCASTMEIHNKQIRKYTNLQIQSININRLFAGSNGDFDYFSLLVYHTVYTVYTVYFALHCVHYLHCLLHPLLKLFTRFILFKLDLNIAIATDQ